MNNAKIGFMRKTNSDGSENPKYVDVLDEDKAVSGQKFVCVSFISPEKILKQKNLFMFQQFLKHFDYSKSLGKFEQFLKFIIYKYGLDNDKIISDLEDFKKSEKDLLLNGTIEDDWKNFLDAKEEEITKDFSENFEFQTNVRGLKVRGSYPTQQEAELRCQMLREIDPNHNVYVGPVGMWMPFEPDAYKTGRVEYLEEELNQLMQEKNKNENKAKQEFEKRVAESKKKAIEENKKLAKEHGNRLTQNIDESSQLQNTSVNSFGGDSQTTSSADIRKELFDRPDVRTKESNKMTNKKIDK
jgi:hypothetical protein